MTERSDEEIEEIAADIAVALAFIQEDSKGRRGVKGSISCPRCGKKLNYSVAKNGHRWGKCETEGCLCWME